MLLVRGRGVEDRSLVVVGMRMNKQTSHNAMQRGAVGKKNGAKDVSQAWGNKDLILVPVVWSA